MAKTTNAKKPASKDSSKSEKKTDKPKKEAAPVVSFDAVQPPATAPKKENKVERVNFEELVASTPAESESAKEKGKEHTPKKSPKSLDFAPAIIDEDHESLSAKGFAFTSKTNGTNYSRRHILEESAIKEFGSNIEILTGKSHVEVAFNVGMGVRVPEEGFFFIRPEA